MITDLSNQTQASPLKATHQMRSRLGFLGSLVLLLMLPLAVLYQLLFSIFTERRHGRSGSGRWAPSPWRLSFSCKGQVI